MYTKKYGFTIVELLIVIVVIAILATIAIVGYNGIQNRARDIAYLTAADQWEKLLRQEFAITGKIPGADGVSTYCLGSSSNNFPATTQFAAGECEYIPGSPPTSSYFSQSFIDEFETKSDFPNGQLPTFYFDLGSGNVVRARGVVAFVGTNGSAYEVHLYWKNNTKGNCARGTDGLLSTTYPLAACERVFTLQ